nr:pancreatic lipase-related protein 3-like [Parasteatoda tepidariorum]
MPNFLTAANARVVGVQVAKLIEYLSDNLGADSERFHVIGNGLGAHIAGYAGERLSRLGRITGLDPSGPYFRSVENEVKLESNDALYVDVISSNPGRNLIEVM